MDKLQKALIKLTPSDRQRIKSILFQINQRHFSGLDVKKLVGQQSIFRVRSGKYRVIFRLTKEQEIFVLAIEKRSDTTYSNF